jgi:ABC-type branched-subunit amino acid transport system ATPase component
VAALVHQKELLFGFMTVREHLLFHASTRLQKDSSTEQIEKRVNSVSDETPHPRPGQSLSQPSGHRVDGGNGAACVKGRGTMMTDVGACRVSLGDL